MTLNINIANTTHIGTPLFGEILEMGEWKDILTSHPTTFAIRITIGSFVPAMAGWGLPQRFIMNSALSSLTLTSMSRAMPQGSTQLLLQHLHQLQLTIPDLHCSPPPLQCPLPSTRMGRLHSISGSNLRSLVLLLQRLRPLTPSRSSSIFSCHQSKRNAFLFQPSLL
jgi:hypothetical protein